MKPGLTRGECEVLLTYKTAFEKILIIQTYCRLMNVDHMSFLQIKEKRQIAISVPKNKESQLKQDVLAVLLRWRKELKLFQRAFILANRLFADLPTSEITICCPKPGRYER